MITFPLWFKIYIGWGVFFIIWNSYLLLAKDKYIAKIRQLPDEKLEEKIKGYNTIVKVLKLFFWAAPFYLILIPYIFYIYISEELFHYCVMIIILYLLTIGTYLKGKSILLILKNK